MPIYEYQCSNCGHHFDELQKISEPPLTKCPACGQDTLKRLIGSGAGLIFKGSGFYLTDYKKKSNPPVADSSIPSKHKKEKSIEHKASSHEVTSGPQSEAKKESKKDKK